MKSEQEILDALKTLQEVCDRNKGKCSNCMLRNGLDECGVLGESSGNYYNNLMERDLKNYEHPRLILN